MMRVWNWLAVLAFCWAASNTAFAAESPWPERRCSPEAGWLQFAEMRLCFEKSDVLSVNVLDLETTALAVRIRMEDGRELDLSLVRLEDQQVTGGLHTRFGIGAREVLRMLDPASRADAAERQLTRKVMKVSDGTEVKQYSDRATSLEAHALIRPGGDSFVYLFQGTRPGAILMAGALTAKDVDYLLARTRW